MTGVRLSGVRKHFGDVLVIDDLSLEINSGEFVVFLGPSGCGKSTLLRMIAGLETVDTGQIHLEGRRIDPLPPGARRAIAGTSGHPLIIASLAGPAGPMAGTPRKSACSPPERVFRSVIRATIFFSSNAPAMAATSLLSIHSTW